VEGGLISGYRSLTEAGQDCASWPASLVAHQQRGGRPPRLLAADRGGYAAANEALAHQARVARAVIPSAGKAPTARGAQERPAWLRRGLRFRAGLEGRMSVRRRRGGLDRCRNHGEAGPGRWVGGMVTANLRKIAPTLAGRLAPPRAQAA
jgi:IS5 family transposase